MVQSVKFHPTNGLMLTGGFDKTLRLFQVRIKGTECGTTASISSVAGHIPFMAVPP